MKIKMNGGPIFHIIPAPVEKACGIPLPFPQVDHCRRHGSFDLIAGVLLLFEVALKLLPCSSHMCKLVRRPCIKEGLESFEL